MADGSTGYHVRAELRQDPVPPLIIALMLAAGALAYPHLPARVPVHWNAAGVPTGWTSPVLGVLAPPAMTLGWWLLLVALPAIDPRRASYADFIGFYRRFRLGTVLLGAAMDACTLTAALGHPLDVGILAPALVALLLLFVGNSLPRVRRNYFFGIRTPWTLADEGVWRRTHRFSGPFFVVGGLVAALGLPFPVHLREAAVLVGTLGAVLTGAVYSYFAYRRHPGFGAGRARAADPFGEGQP